MKSFLKISKIISIVSCILFILFIIYFGFQTPQVQEQIPSTIFITIFVILLLIFGIPTLIQSIKQYNNKENGIVDNEKKSLTPLEKANNILLYVIIFIALFDFCFIILVMSIDHNTTMTISKKIAVILFFVLILLCIAKIILKIVSKTKKVINANNQDNANHQDNTNHQNNTINSNDTFSKLKANYYNLIAKVMMIIGIILIVISSFNRKEGATQTSNPLMTLGFILLILCIPYFIKLNNDRKERQYKITMERLSQEQKQREEEAKKWKSADYFVNNYYKDTKITGAYILWNATTNKYYVGQGQNTTQRIKNHFVGKGNPDVYFDYRIGHKFGVKIIALNQTHFTNLDDLERNLIDQYKANITGYNKTKGNG